MIPRNLANIFEFPVEFSARQQDPGPRLSGVPRYFSEVQDLGVQGVSDLLELTTGIIQKINRLVEYMDENRDEARMSGVETIAIELSAILEGGKLQKVEKALGESVRTRETPLISIDGFSKLRRAEFLAIEADKAIDRHIKTPTNVSMGQVTQWTGSSAPSRLIESLPLILFGVIGAGAILTVIIMSMTRER